MSGGHFDYRQYLLNDIASEIERVVERNDSSEVDEFGDKIGYGYNEETLKYFKEAIVLLKKCGKMVHDIDYLICGDYSEDTFLIEIKKKD